MPGREPPPASSGETSITGSECSSYIADFAYYPPVSEFLVVPPGTPIEVVGPATITEMLVTDPNGEPFPATSGIPAALPSDDGMLVYDVHAEWPQGTGDFFFGIQTLGDPANAPDVLTLDCTSFVARLDTAVVRTQPDGLHLRIVGDTNGFAIGTPGPDGTGEPTSAIGGTDQGSVALRPGQWGIKCGKGSAIGSLLAPFELIDPDDHYAPWELTCAAGSGSTFSSSVPTSTPHADVIEQLVTGSPRAIGSAAPGTARRHGASAPSTWSTEAARPWRASSSARRAASGRERSRRATAAGSSCRRRRAVRRHRRRWRPTSSRSMRGTRAGARARAGAAASTTGFTVEATNVADASFVMFEHDDGTSRPGDDRLRSA